ncbi:transposase [Bacillus cereus]|uniref:transposase n=1 Tax=Bacillus cereus TaxID=1396 RepID=UPI000BEDEEF4|nr:hypothetical protein CON37_02290 [Bacillus cereus]
MVLSSDNTSSFIDTFSLHKGGIFCTRTQWRALPKDYPKWQNVYRYYAKWSKSNAEGSSLLETLLKKLLGK